MKQGDVEVFRIGIGAALIRECSGCATGIPHLTLMQPAFDGNANEPAFPARSMEFYGEGVRDIYAMLKKYYEAK